MLQVIHSLNYCSLKCSYFNNTVVLFHIKVYNILKWALLKGALASGHYSVRFQHREKKKLIYIYILFCFLKQHLIFQCKHIQKL